MGSGLGWEIIFELNKGFLERKLLISGSWLVGKSSCLLNSLVFDALRGGSMDNKHLHLHDLQ
jgi:hypothetical protein